MAVLFVVEHDRGVPPEATWGALSRSRDLAERLGLRLEALVIGAGVDDLAATAGEFGAPVVHIAGSEVLTDYGPEAWGHSVAHVVRETGATVVCAAGTERGNEVLAQAAARLGEPMVANATDVDPGDPWAFTRIRWGGSLLEETRLDAGTRLFTYATHTTEPIPAPVETEIRPVQIPSDADLVRTIIVDREEAGSGLSLASAQVVVGGGRGVGSKEGFEILDDLAGLLGGAVGCSRVVTNNGWRPHSDQIGQTGTKIGPRIYIACGISGAIQHWVGAIGSKMIIAVNTDPEANMVAKADYAVIGDLHDVLPAIAREVRNRKT